MAYTGATTPNVGTTTGNDLKRDITIAVLEAFARRTRFMDLLRVDTISAGANAGRFIIEGKEDTSNGALATYTAGTQVQVSNGTQDEVIVPLDRPQYESRRIDKWEATVASYDVEAMNVRQLGSRLANAIDRKAAAAVEAASLSTDNIAGNGTGTVIVNAGIVLPMTNPSATGLAFAQSIYAACAKMMENDVFEDVYVACSPTAYSSLPQSLVAIDRDYVSDNGGYDTGEIKMVGGAKVFMTNNLPTTAGLVALAFTSEAAGIVKLWDVRVDVNTQADFLDARLINAYFSNGMKALRPQCAVSIKNV